MGGEAERHGRLPTPTADSSFKKHLPVLLALNIMCLAFQYDVASNAVVYIALEHHQINLNDVHNNILKLKLRSL